jgi:hypothetical protein
LTVPEPFTQVRGPVPGREPFNGRKVPFPGPLPSKGRRQAWIPRRQSSKGYILLSRLGEGWTAPEALAIALFCSLRAGDFEEGVRLSVNLTGDSDSTGSITGNILGTLWGCHAIPDRWLSGLELRGLIVEMADDLALLPAAPLPDYRGKPESERRESAYWQERYPGW